MSTPDERPTRPLPADDAPDDPGTAPLEDTMTTAPGTGPSAEQPTTPLPTTPAADEAPASRTAAQPVTPPAGPAPRPHRGMRVGTMVWGLVLAAIGAGVLAWAVGVSFDVELAFIILVAAAGVLLLVGSVATTLRRRR